MKNAGLSLQKLIIISFVLIMLIYLGLFVFLLGFGYQLFIVFVIFSLVGIGSILISSHFIKKMIGLLYESVVDINGAEALRKHQETEKEKLILIADQTELELKDLMRISIEKESLSSIGSLVSGITHEINTPLGVSLTAASFLEEIRNSNKNLLEEGLMTRDDFVRFFDKTSKATIILTSNISRALELAKSFEIISVNQRNEGKTSFVLFEFIETVLVSLRHEYKNKEIKFNVVCPRELVITSYLSAFAHILTNLIMNSIIHGFKDQTKGNIRIEAFKQNNNLFLTVSDDGSGIPVENMGRVFDPFFTTNRVASSGGLGLSLVYNIVGNQLGGSIRCDSRTAAGTTFTIEIPLGGDEINGRPMEWERH